MPTALPAANNGAALTVFPNSDAGTDAAAAFCDSNFPAAMPIDGAMPWRASRFANNFRAAASRLESVPSGIFSRLATSLRVRPCKSHKTTGRRYLSGKLFTSRSSSGYHSCHGPAASTCG